jgi:hypothetical protein
MILGISLKKVEASIGKVDKLSELKVNSTPSITSIEAKDVAVLGIKNALVVEFEFKTDYEPKIGSIKLEGELLYKDDKAKEIADEWKKNKKISDKVAVPILNAIFRRCLLKVMNEAEDLQLPPPIRFPSVYASEEKAEKKK